MTFLLRSPASAASTAHTDPAFYRRLEAHISSDLRDLAQSLQDQAAMQAGPADDDSAFRFLYFNHMNLALKTSLSSKTAPLTLEVIKVLRSIHDEFLRSPAAPNEICVRTRSDGWVIGRKSTATSREFFVLLDERAGELTDVSSCVRLCDL